MPACSRTSLTLFLISLVSNRMGLSCGECLLTPRHTQNYHDLSIYFGSHFCETAAPKDLSTQDKALWFDREHGFRANLLVITLDHQTEVLKHTFVSFGNVQMLQKERNQNQRRSRDHGHFESIRTLFRYFLTLPELKPILLDTKLIRNKVRELLEHSGTSRHQMCFPAGFPRKTNSK